MRVIESNFRTPFMVIVFCLGFQPDLALAEDNRPLDPPKTIEEFNGIAEAWSSVEILPRANGIVTEAISSIGLQVHQGDVLMQIDPSEYDIAVERARDQMMRAQIRLDAVKAVHDRTKKMGEKNLVAQKAVISSIVTLELARSDLELEQVDLKEAELLLSRTIVKSPIDGFVSEVNVSVGDVVNFEFPETAFLLLSFDPIRIRVEMDEAMEIALVRAERTTGAKVTKVEMTLADGSLYPELGEVIGSSHQVNPQTGKVAHFLSFPNKDLTVLPGSSVTVKVTFSALGK